MRPGHGGMISRLCACRRDHRDVRRPHRERARHRGGAAAACVARRATEWHACAVPTLPGGPSYRFSALRGCTAHPVRSFRSRVMAGGMVGEPFRALRVPRRPRPAPERRRDARARSDRPPCSRVADLSQAVRSARRGRGTSPDWGPKDGPGPLAEMSRCADVERHAVGHQIRLKPRRPRRRGDNCGACDMVYPLADTSAISRRDDVSTGGGRLPVWLLGLCNFPLGAYFAVMLLTVPQMLAANAVPQPTIASVTAIGL